MSKTFTSRPSVVRNRNPSTSDRNQPGTGSGPIPAYPNMSNRGRASMASGRGTSLTVGTDGPVQTTNSQPVEQRMSYQGCYTMISPNEKKKKEIEKQASKEMQNYQQYKEQQKVGHLNYVGTAGGGEITQQQARRKLIQQNRNPNMRLREKRDEFRSQQKKKEEEEINQKRKRQRELAEKNVLRSKQTEVESRNRWDEEMKKRNDQFLSKFEGKSNNSRPEESATESRSQTFDPASDSQDTTLDPPGASWNDYSDGDIQNDLERLHSMFPHFDRNALQEILDQTHSVEGALEVLQAD